jgi:choline dehydrogenase-like flavoprotein
VLSGLQSSGIDVGITVFSSDRYLESSPGDRYDSEDVRRFYADVYEDIKRGAVGYPPRKTFFGESIPCHSVEGRPRFFRTDMFGGQTNIWGGTVLPLTEQDFSDWPVTRADLEPHYAAIASLIGIAGRHDQLSRFLRLDFSNRPPVKQLSGFEFLERHLNEYGDTGTYTVHAGIAPSAVDTQPDSATSCTQCGECMVGCIRDSIYTARSTLGRYVERTTIDFVGRNVDSVRPRGDKVELRLADGSSRTFSRVFLCAGCVSTTEILMRSLGLEEGPVLQDNLLYQFPILNLSRYTDANKDKYFGLTNLVLLLEPQAPGLPLLQIQIYPNADYLWRTLVPRWFWGVARHPVRWSRDRLMWARAYMDSADSYRYPAALEGGRIVFREEGTPSRTRLRPCIDSLRKALRGSRCYLAPFPPVAAPTSAHLAGTFPYGEAVVPVSRDGEVMPRVHIADSSCFPRSPVISPTLTIMANARRTALEAVRS